MKYQTWLRVSRLKDGYAAREIFKSWKKLPDNIRPKPSAILPMSLDEKVERMMRDTS